MRGVCDNICENFMMGIVPTTTMIKINYTAHTVDLDSTNLDMVVDANYLLIHINGHKKSMV